MEEMQRFLNAQAALDAGSNGLAAAYLKMDSKSSKTDMQAAINKGTEENMREFAFASLEQAQGILTEQGDTMEALQKGMLDGYITQLKGALDGSAIDMGAALEWLKAFKIPIEVVITTNSNGTTIKTPNGTRYSPAPPAAGSVNGEATGTPYFKGGYTWVGERGPEFVELPRAARVTPSEHSAQRAQDVAAGRGTINVSIGGTYYIREEADVKKIANELAHELERELLCGAH
jgi:hypothetical protein